MIDAHCHIDAYPDPYKIAELAQRSKVLTIAVTNRPAHFIDSRPHVQQFGFLRPALGLHPLLAEHTQSERQQFARALDDTSYVGEVGLDFSREGIATRTEQEESFRFVLELIKDQPKFLSIHSRRAESATLDYLEEYEIPNAVFHWFTGSIAALDRLLNLGYYCSVNPAMLQKPKGQRIVDRIPLDRLLTESDGPYVLVGQRQAIPTDVTLVEAYLLETRNIDHSELKGQLKRNLLASLPMY